MSKNDKLEKRKNLILSRFGWSQRWRQPWDTKWLRWYKMYRGVVPVLPEFERDRSNLHIPYAYSTVDTIRSRLLNAVFANRPWISFVPKDEDDVENARNMESLVDHQLSRADVDSTKRFYTLITDMLLYGACPFETGWKYETRTVKRRIAQEQQGVLMGYDVQEVEIPLWDDPDWQPFMVDDLFPDPEGTTIDDCSWVIRRRYISEDELKQQVEQGIYEVSDDDWEQIRAGSDEINEGKQDRLASIGAAWETAGAEVESQRHELLEMWEDDHVSTLINKVRVIRDEDNPFWHGKKPFGLVRFDPLNGEFYGISLVEVMEYLQAELNTTRNQRVDANNLSIYGMWKALKDSGLDPADLVPRPGGIIWLDSLDGALEEVKMTPPSAGAFEEESVIKQDIQEATATYAEARGGQSDSKRTATENVIRDKSVSIRFDTKVKLFEACGLKRLGFFFDHLNQQFIDDEKKIRSRDEEGYYNFDSLKPEDLAGQYEYLPAGSNVEGALDKLSYREGMVELYSLMKDEPDVRQYELKKRVFDAYGVKDVEKLLKSEGEVEQEQAELMQGQGQQQGQEIPGEVPQEELTPEELAQLEMMQQQGMEPQQQGGFGVVAQELEQQLPPGYEGERW